jgi:hypothetical protein
MHCFPGSQKTFSESLTGEDCYISFKISSAGPHTEHLWGCSKHNVIIVSRSNLTNFGAFSWLPQYNSVGVEGYIRSSKYDQVLILHGKWSGIAEYYKSEEAACCHGTYVHMEESQVTIFLTIYILSVIM